MDHRLECFLQNDYLKVIHLHRHEESLLFAVLQNHLSYFLIRILDGDLESPRKEGSHQNAGDLTSDLARSAKVKLNDLPQHFPIFSGILSKSQFFGRLKSGFRLLEPLRVVSHDCLGSYHRDCF